MTTNFDLRVRAEGNSGRYAVEVSTSPTGETTPVIQDAPTVPADILEVWQAGLMSEGDAQTLGAQLYQWLFPAPVRERWGASTAHLAARKEVLRLRLRIEPPELSRLPWELCWDTQDEFLALLPDVAWVRYIAEPFAASPLATPAPIKLLIAVASPADLPELDADGEATRIMDSLSRVNDDIQFKVIPHTTWDRMQDALADGVDVVHFIGHGDINDNGEGYLAFENDEGTRNPVTAKQLRVLFRGRDVKLVVLNACQSAVASGQEAIMAVAPSLVRSGIPAVIAQQTPVPDSVAKTFAKTLYEYLAKGTPLDEIITEMRIGAYGKASHQALWGIPVLFMRAPDGKLWQQEQANTTDTSKSNKGGVNFSGINNSSIQIGTVVGGDFISSSPQDDTVRREGESEE